MNFTKNTAFSMLHANDYASGPLIAIDWMREKQANVLLGPVEDFTLGSICRYSAYRYKVPVITPGGWAPGLDDKNEFSVLTRSMGTFSNMGPLFTSIMQEFNWPPRDVFNVAMIIRRKPYANQFICEGIKNSLTSRHYKIWDDRSSMEFAEFDIGLSLKEVSRKSRSKRRRAKGEAGQMLDRCEG